MVGHGTFMEKTYIFWHTFFSEKDRTPFAAVYSSLGCKFGCNFCMVNILNRNSVNENDNAANYRIMRHWDPNFFLNQLEILAGYGVKTLRLSDEMFFLNRKFFGRGVFRSIIIIPMVIAPAIMGQFWSLLYDQKGVFNFFLESITYSSYSF